MATYSIENAKSGRSSCKKCKEKIAKGDLRIGETTEMPDGGPTFTKWIKVSCFAIPRKLKSQGVTPESFLEEHLEDNTEDHVLSDQGQFETILKQIKAAGAPTKKRNKTEKDGSTLLSKLKADAERILQEEDDDDGEGPAKKKTKLSKEDRSNATAYLDYKSLKNDELKDILRWNQQLVSGTKGALITRIIDGHVKGRLGRCASCEKGRYKLSEDDGGKTVKCNGYYDEDLGTRIPCYSTLEADKAPRLKPWYQNEPTEEQKEEMEAQMNEETKPDDGDGDNASNELSDAVGKIDWDLSNPMGIKKAAKDMLEVCSSKASSIDLPTPEKKARMQIGKLILGNKEKSASEVLKLIIDQFGLKKTKAKAAKAKSEAIASVCKVEANAPILEVILELGDLYFRESNANAGGTYKRVGEAIKNIDYEITTDNAKGLCKGKTKVPGIGKSSSDKIFEFLTTGKIEKLEEKRAAAM